MTHSIRVGPDGYSQCTVCNQSPVRKSDPCPGPPPLTWEELLGQIACLDQIPHDALDQFIEMLQANFPTSLEGVSGLA